MASWLGKLSKLARPRPFEEEDYLLLPTSSAASTPVTHLDREGDPDEVVFAGVPEAGSCPGTPLDRPVANLPGKHMPMLACFALCARQRPRAGLEPPPMESTSPWNESAIHVDDFRDAQIKHWLVTDSHVQFSAAVSPVLSRLWRANRMDS